MNLLFIAIPANADITTGLVGWWKFDEHSSGTCSGSSVIDSSGQGNTGACGNSPTWVLGKIGQGAMGFSAASSQYVNVGKGASLNMSGDMSIAVWGYLNNFSGYPVFIGDHNSSGAYSQFLFGLYNTNGSLSFSFGIPGNSTSWYTANNVLTTGQWYHLAATRVGSGIPSDTVKIYVNGVVVSTTTLQQGSGLGSVFSNVGNTAIGRTGDYNGDYLDGKMDEVRLYNRALSASDVMELYNYTGAAVGRIRINGRAHIVGFHVKKGTP